MTELDGRRLEMEIGREYPRGPRLARDTLVGGLGDVGQGVATWPRFHSLPATAHSHTAFAIIAGVHGKSIRACPMSDVTRILSAIEQGDGQAAGELLPRVYDELCRFRTPDIG